MIVEKPKSETLLCSSGGRGTGGVRIPNRFINSVLPKISFFFCVTRNNDTGSYIIGFLIKASLVCYLVEGLNEYFGG